MTKLHRSQILLERSQYERLRRLAEEEEQSLSGLVREAVGEYVLRRESEKRIKKRLAALEKAARLRSAILRDRGGKPLEQDWGESIRRMRAERDDEAIGNGREA